MAHPVSSAAVDVIISGAGPTGLSLAADLLRWGVSFRIFDRKSGPERYSKAANFWPRTQEVAAVGYYDRVRARSVVPRSTTVNAFGSYIGHPTPAAPPSPTPHPETLAINQGHFETIMVDYLREHGVEIEYDTSVVNARELDDKVETVIERDGVEEIVHAAYLVACDGGRSIVRERLGFTLTSVPLQGRSLQQIDARLRWSRLVDHGELWFFMFNDGFCGVVPLPDGYYRVFVCRDETLIPDRPPTLEEMQETLRWIADDPRVELYDPVWLTHGKFRYGVATTFQKGRVFLAGDAGHVTIPIGGQGMNTGIQDAFNLGWKLAAVLQGQAKPILLDSYSPERQQVREELAQDQVANFNRLMFPTPWSRFLTKRLGPIMMKRQKSVELGRRDETQLSIHYPNSPIVEDLLGKNGVKAGDRAPEAPVVSVPTLETVTLFSLIYGHDWTLLGFDDACGFGEQSALLTVLEQVSAAFPTVRHHLVIADTHAPKQNWDGHAVLFDLDRYAHEAYRIDRPSLVLVRPDGYIGFRGNVQHVSALLTYCERILIAHQSDGPQPSAIRERYASA